MNAEPQSAAPFEGLTPEAILAAVESTGVHCSGHLLALNSYENRVYQVGIDDDDPLIVKFYRAGRWCDESILEEHAFTAELIGRDIPVVAPLTDISGATLLRHGGFRFTLFPRRGGRLLDLDDPVRRRQIGRQIGRLHAVGEIRPFRHRLTIDIDTYGRAPLSQLQSVDFIPDDLTVALNSVAEDALTRAAACFERAGQVHSQRLHGDCHPGNLLWDEDRLLLVDLDDCANGPAIQDLWMLLYGERDEMAGQLREVLAGYREFHHFDNRELYLLEALRTLRMLHHAAWLAKRWDDPAFPRAFPWFGQPRYWQDLILSLREQIALMDEPPLDLENY